MGFQTRTIGHRGYANPSASFSKGCSIGSMIATVIVLGRRSPVQDFDLVEHHEFDLQLMVVLRNYAVYSQSLYSTRVVNWQMISISILRQAQERRILDYETL